MRKILFALALTLLASTAQAAITFDAATDGLNNGGATTSLTFAHTVTGTDPLIVVGFQGDLRNAADDCASVTWNGTAMTFAKKGTTSSAASRFTYTYYLLAAATGTHNVVITCGSSHYILGGAVSYSGVGGALDNSNETFSAADADFTLTTALTTVADNCWVILYGGSSGSSVPTAGTGSTRRAYDVAFNTWGFFDSNATITPAGSYSMTWTSPSGTPDLDSIMLSFSPTGGSSPPATNRLLLLGVGN